MDFSADLHGRLDPWPSKVELAHALRSAGLEVSVGRYSIRVRDCDHFVFEHYGGDNSEPQIDADAESFEAMLRDGRLVSDALTKAQIRHQFEIYDSAQALRAFLHYDMPPPDGAPIPRPGT